MNKEQLQKANEISEQINIAKRAIESVESMVTKQKKYEAMKAVDPTGRSCGDRVVISIDSCCHSMKSPVLPMLELELQYQKAELKKLEAQFAKI